MVVWSSEGSHDHDCWNSLRKWERKGDPGAPSSDLLRGEFPLSLGKHFIANHEFPDSGRAQKWRVVMSMQLPVVPLSFGL